jgi:VanZ family protein
MSVFPNRTAPYLWAAYVLIVVLASLNPLTGWRDTGVSPWAFLADPWPQYLTRFDWVTNVAAYAPLGFLTLLALPSTPAARTRGWLLAASAITAALLCSGLSLAMEALQVYLPHRIPALSDWFANSLGALLGVIAALCAILTVERSPLLKGWFARAFDPHAGPLQALIGLWMLAQLHPVSAAFVTGRFVPDLLHLAGAHAGKAYSPAWFDASEALSSDQFALLEMVAGATGLISVLACGRLVLQTQGPRLVLMLLLLLAALLAKTVACALQFGPTSALVWWTDGAQAAVIAGTAVAVALALLPRGWAVLTGVTALMLLLALANAVPDNPYFAATLTRWHEGRFINFFGLTQFVAAVWPFIAMAALTWRGWKKA